MADDYVHVVEDYRKRKDEAFRVDPHSPIPRHERTAFGGLRYYPPNPAWRFQARLVPHERPQHVTMQASDGGAKHHVNVGHFEITAQGQTVKVQAYENASGHGLFIPFRDRTSGKETYGAGRYLDVEESSPGVYDLDFNFAYNPSCAYDDAYSCPFPPPENWLQVEIRAGEKTYKD